MYETDEDSTPGVPNNLEAFWMPFTANRQFKSNPRLLVAAKDMHYTSHDGRQILDGTAGLWCVNAGHNAFARGQPGWGAHLADELERLVALHDASTIAAVIVEPVAGSTGVLVPPKGYLERLRRICDKHGILLIFDEVITGFGRLGSAFAAH